MACLPYYGKRSDKQKDSGKEVGVVTVGTGEVGGGAAAWRLEGGE